MGLSTNPFSTRFVRPGQMPYRFPKGVDPAETINTLVRRFQTESALAIIGPHGTGKTTLARDLIARLAAHPGATGFDHVRLVRLDSSSAPVGPVAATRWLYPRTVLVIDGFEQLPVVSRLAVLGRVRFVDDRSRLLITAHRRQWFVPTFWFTSWHAEIVRELTAEKIAHLPVAQRTKMQQVADQLATQQLYGSKTNGPAAANVRDYWFALYDAYEKLRIARGAESATGGTRSIR